MVQTVSQLRQMVTRRGPQKKFVPQRIEDVLTLIEAYNGRPRPHQELGQSIYDWGRANGWVLPEDGWMLELLLEEVPAA